MKTTAFSIVVVIAVVTLVSGCGQSSRLSVGERRHRIHSMEAQTLGRLYREHPSAREKIRNAAGYGVFANTNVNVIFASAGGGYGSVVDNLTGQRTYMKMALGGVGLGIGVKDYRQVLIFKSRSVLKKFVDSGWEFGGHADVAAKAGEIGGELSGEEVIGPDIEAYSMTESGLVLQATIAGTKYWIDDDLRPIPQVVE